MEALPPPPPAAILQALGPDLHVVPAGTTLWRIYARGGAFPTTWREFRYFGPLPTIRFDHHLPDANGHPCHQSRGILYTGTLTDLCVAEVFQDTRFIDRLQADRWLVGFTLTRDVALLDLCGLWPTRAGGSMVINSGPRGPSRAWSAAIYEVYAAVEGLWHASSMYGNVPGVVLYERARDALPATPDLHRALADPAMKTVLMVIADRINYDIDLRPSQPGSP